MVNNSKKYCYFFNQFFVGRNENNMRRLYADIILNKDELKDSSRSLIEIEYYKISKKIWRNVGKKINLYGIEIIKKEYLGRRKVKEKNNLYNITSDEGVIDNLLNVLKRNRVTPIGLKDVIEEVM